MRVPVFFVLPVTLSGAYSVCPAYSLRIYIAVSLYLDLKPLGKEVYDRNADAVEAA